MFWPINLRGKLFKTQASGINPKPTELEILFEKIVERSEAGEQSRHEEEENTFNNIVQLQLVSLTAFYSMSINTYAAVALVQVRTIHQ